MSNTDDAITCAICGSREHHIETHLKKAHPTVSLADYQRDYPDAPLMSATFEKRLEEAKQKKAQAAAQQAQAQHKMVASIIPFVPKDSVIAKPMHEVFEMPYDESMQRPLRRGETQPEPIMVDVRTGLDEIDTEAVPMVDEGYVFRAEELKDVVTGLKLNIPVLVWGFHGAGKTTLLEQVCARLNLPCLRVQHTETTEEAHITGQMVVRNGATEFEFGPLAEAMMRGWVYIADEYDFAHPAVIAVYQAVLEGKPLYIKEAPASRRLTKPHPHFRFFATGNTNGSGDDTGLYSGTKIGNAAAYSRFGITIQVHYPDEDVETSILVQRVGINKDVAKRLVEFATSVREMYGNGELSLPISPREIIRAATLGAVRGGKFIKGIELAYANRLDKIQSQAVLECAQRLFG